MTHRKVRIELISFRWSVTVVDVSLYIFSIINFI